MAFHRRFGVTIAEGLSEKGTQLILAAFWIGLQLATSSPNHFARANDEPPKSNLSISATSGEIIEHTGTESSTIGASPGKHEPPLVANYVFDFSNKDTKLLLPTLPFVNQTGSFTCSSWVRIDGDPKNGSHTIFQYANGGTDMFGFRIATGSGGGRFRAIRYDGSYHAVQSNRGGFNLGQWTHAVMICFGGRLSLYVNGVDLTEPAHDGALGIDKQIGEQTHGSVKSEHRQGDTRFYDRVLTAEEIKQIFAAGRNDDRKSPQSARDYAARWHPDSITTRTIRDLSPNEYHLTLTSTDPRIFMLDQPTTPQGIRKLFAVGNSLTVDSSASVLAPQSDWTINPSQSMIFHAATPMFSTYPDSYLWGKALANERYDVLMLQPFPTRPAQTISAEVAAMQLLINQQPNAIVMIHEGFAPANSVRVGTEINASHDGKIRHSNACFEEIVRHLKSANPGRDIRRSRTNEAVHLVASDLANGRAVGITGIGLTFGRTELYRDELHINHTHGRYLIHHCVRRAMGITEKRRDFPFINHPQFGSAEAATLDYLDTVIERVFSQGS